MANKHLQLNPHRIRRNKEIFEDVCWYENDDGIWVHEKGGNGFTIKWSSLRAALKRKDKK